MSPAKVLLYFLLFFIGGIFSSSFLNIPKLIIYELFLLGILYSLVFFKEKTIVVFGICLIVLGFGVLRTEMVKPTLALSSEEGTPEDGYYKISQSSSVIEDKIAPVKYKLREIINENLSPPHSSILAALTIGDKKYIPKEWKEKLNLSGVRHITAVSGLHVVIISGILLWLGLRIGLYRGQAFYFALFFLWLFIVIIGFQPSAIRAGLMGSMFLFCQRLGRKTLADRALLLTGALMLLLDPLLLRYDIGFQLSFLATLGIIYLMPFLHNFFEKIKLTKLGEVSNLLAMTFAAQIFVLPILVYNFGQISLISPMTNILIVPLLPYIMTAGFIFLIGGLLWFPLGWILSFPVWILLTYLIKIVDLFSRFSFSSITFQISWLPLPLFYTVLGFFLYYLSKKEKLKLKY